MRPPAPILCALLSVVAGTSLSCAPDPVVPDAPAPAQHVLIVVVDTLRADRCSVNGYDRETTPALDRLARESVVYEDCWAPAPWTGPSHASLFTGLRPEEHGFLRRQNAFLPDGAETLAERLTAEGFHTLCVSTNPNVGPVRNLDQGFQSFVPAYRFVSAEEEGGGAPAGMRAVRYDSASDACTKAFDGLAAAAAEGRRSFTFLNLFDPHFNYDPPAGPSERFVRPARPEVEQWARMVQFPICSEPALGVREFTDEEWTVLSDLYDAEVYTSDEALGELFDKLRASVLLESTLVVITSDHGEMIGEEGLADHAFHMRPELLRIPLLIRWPDVREGGRRVQDLVRLEDVYPTVLEALALTPAEGVSGVTLTADTAGRISFAATDPPVEAEQILAARYPGYALDRARRSFRSVADGRYHYLRDDAGRQWLWDLQEDPRGLANVARRQRNEADRLHELLNTVYPGW